MIRIDRHHLPDDIPTLKGMILQLLDVVAQQQAVITAQSLKIDAQQQIIVAQAVKIEQQQRQIDAQHIIIETQAAKIAEQAARITALEHEVSVLKRQLFGRRSERAGAGNVTLLAKPFTPSAKTAPKGRQVLPEDLPREVVSHEIDASQRICVTCGDLMPSIGVITSEQVDLVPAKVVVLQHMRHKYACRTCQDKVLIAHKPAQPIDKGLPTAAVLAEVLVSKYADHCALYRQQQRWARLGVDFSRATMSRWVLQCGILLQPLVERIEQLIVKSDHLFTDDTPLPVLAPQRCRQGRLWIYATKDRPGWPGCTVYRYTQTRQGQEPQAFLKDFQGHIQADAYAGFDRVYNEVPGQARIEVACWAHVRRKFTDITATTRVPGLAHEAVQQIQALYQVERQATDQQLTGDERRQYRLMQALPLLNILKQWLDTHQTDVVPKSPLGGAINYALKNWTALNTYLQRGALEIDNNRAERGMRPIALGRKNYLFAGSHQAGQAAAAIYSLIETCKLHHINPQAYLEHVLNLVSTHPNKRIDELLPWNFSQQTQRQKAA